MRFRIQKLAHNVDTIGDPLPLIDAIHARQMKAGVAISPDTPSTAITDEIGAAADMLTIMTVYPGIYIHSASAGPCATLTTAES